MEDVEVGHCGGDAVELVQQRRIDIVEKLGAHKARRITFSDIALAWQRKQVPFALALRNVGRFAFR